MSANKNEFSGDLLLRYDKENECADIVLQGGMLQDCRGLETAIYLSLFGGGAAKDTEAWWGNSVIGTKQNEVLDSASYKLSKGVPMTSSTLKQMQAAAQDDLKWLVNDGIADSVDVQVYAETSKRARLEVRVLKDGGEVFAESFPTQWDRL